MLASEATTQSLPNGWKHRTLGELGESIIGLTFSPSQVSSHGTLVLRSSNIQNGRLDLADCVHVAADIPAKLRVQPDDILICARNGSRDLIGKCLLLDSRVKGMSFGAFMAVYRSPLNWYVIYQLQAEPIRGQVRSHLGATINQITSGSLQGFTIPVPDDEHEQRAIAAALSDADALIAALERLIAKKRDIKQGAMQELLTGRRRLPGFEGAWETRRLGELGRFSKGRGIKRDQVTGEGLPCIRYGELYTKYENYTYAPESRIPPGVAATALKIEPGAILFAGSGETAVEIGRCVAYLGLEPAYAGGDIVVLTPRGQDSLYLAHLLNHPSIASQKARFGQGDAVVHIHAKHLEKIEVTTPELAEQAAIATILTDMDAEITALEARLTKARDIKQGMMQQLLTGRIRLHAVQGESQ
ncbi:MAG: restriction endonuclease subunit S [Phycisphaerales bacterium]